MILLNTIVQPNTLVAHALEYLAVYNDGVVSVYRKNNDATLVKLVTEWTIAGLTKLSISPNGRVLAAQTVDKTCRLLDGVERQFDTLGEFAISDSGLLIVVSVSTGAVQLIAESTTNLTVAVTDDDRIVCGRLGYTVYNTARSLYARYGEVVLNSTPSAKEIIFCMHTKDDNYAFFYKDGTASHRGLSRAVSGPLAGFREAGNHLVTTDYKNEYCVSRFNPLSRVEMLHAFKWLPPLVSTSADWNGLKLLATGNSLASATFDVKNALDVVSVSDVVVAQDSPFGADGSSLEFNGTTSCLQTGDSTDIQLGSADFTIELFVKISNIPVNALVFHKGADGTLPPSYVLTATTNKSFNFNVSIDGTAYGYTLLDVGKFELDVWTHVAITRKANKWRFFQDGMLKGSFTFAGSLFPHTGKGLQLGHYRLGNYTSGALTALFNGRIHAFAIHNRAKYTSNFVVDTIPLAVVDD